MKFKLGASAAKRQWQPSELSSTIDIDMTIHTDATVATTQDMAANIGLDRSVIDAYF